MSSIKIILAILGLLVGASFSEGCAPVQQEMHVELYRYQDDNGLYGYIDGEHKVVIPAKYEYALDFSDGLAVASFDDFTYGYIKPSGEVAIPFKYSNAFSFVDGIARVNSEFDDCADSVWSFIDKNGNKLFDREFAAAYSFSEGYAVVLIEGYIAPLPPEQEMPRKWSFIDTSGKLATSLEFDEAESFESGFAVVAIADKWHVMNLDFELLSEYATRDEARAAADKLRK